MTYAHAGGADEALMIIVPLAVFIAYRWFSTRRELQAPDEEDQPPGDD